MVLVRMHNLLCQLVAEYAFLEGASSLLHHDALLVAGRFLGTDYLMPTRGRHSLSALVEDLVGNVTVLLLLTICPQRVHDLNLRI